VDHPVAIKGMIAAQAIMHRIFGIADIKAIDVDRNFANDL
tara:strand:+ start:414 stop:533 length:120 start_codon:yes stop_codon:yes gene_type:complete